MREKETKAPFEKRHCMLLWNLEQIVNIAQVKFVYLTSDEQS
jgi:hypothetical protein